MEALTATGYGRTIEEARADAEAQLAEMIRARDEAAMVGGWLLAFLTAMLGLAWALWNAMLRPVAAVPVMLGFALAIAAVMGVLQAMMHGVENPLLMVLLALLMVGALLGMLTALGRMVPAAILRVELWEARLLVAALNRSPRLGALLHGSLLLAAAAGGWVMAGYIAKLLAGFGLGDAAAAGGWGVFGSGLALVWRCWRHPLIGRVGAWRILREGFAPRTATA
jgi:hypothetical protein